MSRSILAAAALVLVGGCATVNPAVSELGGGQSAAAPAVAMRVDGGMPAPTKPSSPAPADDSALGGGPTPTSPRSADGDRAAGDVAGVEAEATRGLLRALYLDTPPELSTWGTGRAQSYLIPAVEIVVFQVVLNLLNRAFSSVDDYDTNFSTIWSNLHHHWVLDNDPFATNQFLHPYQGSIYHGLARSAGLSYWEALAYDLFGSTLWEIAGENLPPSLNDEITTTLGGSFLGEALFRMASYFLENADEHRPGFFRELTAALVSPPTAFNRLAFGDRFDAVFPSRGPAVFASASIGARGSEQVSELGNPGKLTNGDAAVEFIVDYGMPGKPGYEYTRPFDYFRFEFTAASNGNAFPENVVVRGMLVGSTYDAGRSYRGIWGLYGGYDYFSPDAFSVSSTSLSLGTTGQWWLADRWALQGSCLGGAGWTAAGRINDPQSDRNYHYGISPQGVAALRLIFDDVAALDVSGRAYYIAAVTGRGGEESETILRAEAGLTVRVYGHHALTLKFVASSRDARFADVPDTSVSVGAVSIFYTYLNDEKLGAVEWR